MIYLGELWIGAKVARAYPDFVLFFFYFFEKIVEGGDGRESWARGLHICR